MTRKTYKSAAAQKLNDQRKAKPKADSKKFKDGSNPHHGASLGQSGQQKAKR